MNLRPPRNELAEAIGRVAVAASHIDVVVRECVGILGGPGARILADEQDSVTRLITWCNKFKDRLHNPPVSTSEEYDRISDQLKNLLVRRNSVIHGIWFAPSDDLHLSKRVRGQRGYVSEPLSIEDVNQLAVDLQKMIQDFGIASRQIELLGDKTRWPDANDDPQ